jgi:hypothetical protein
VTRAVIAGWAYGRRATIEIAGDAITWRAQRGAPENIATTIHNLRGATWIERAWSIPGGILAALGGVWLITEGLAWGSATLVVAITLIAYRHARPLRYLALDLGDRQLVLRVAGVSAGAARQLAAQIERAIASGDAPAEPPTLP